eukprot:CAMPEP_0119116420 /NCGR_PEP_ID=MMETSP1180-20130426/52275_1 /TAXON_ID=3052 ORGANISM="Chlamydomonas cf sp, Strain CCMP681" /NCGR_SAMPLE_ID=MMETSP1180 /ASSEMBLY_ACC=CAM_ASM_000741 /LENGTH=36 /DNA_ID= /DNA_START= /DNA_END= /DNA_ORIENTATION=
MGKPQVQPGGKAVQGEACCGMKGSWRAGCRRLCERE